MEDKEAKYKCQRFFSPKLQEKISLEIDTNWLCKHEFKSKSALRNSEHLFSKLVYNVATGDGKMEVWGLLMGQAFMQVQLSQTKLFSYGKASD